MHTTDITVLAILSTLVNTIAAQGNCTIFTPDTSPGYLLTYPPQRISSAITCPRRNNESHPCPLTASGDVLHSWTYNISRSLPDAYWNERSPYLHEVSFLHNLISASLNVTLAGTPWNESVIGSIDTTVPLAQGATAYLNFTGLKRCFSGSLSNCSGGLTDGVAVEACAPVYHTVGRKGSGAVLDGNYTIVNVDAVNVSGYPDPFMGQSRGSAGSAGMGVERVGLRLVGFVVMGVSLVVL